MKTIDRARALHILRWLEANCDYSMVLDLPTGGIQSGQVATHAERLRSDGEEPAIQALARDNRLSYDFNLALHQTALHNSLFAEHLRPGATTFLNVLQGRNERESLAWYQHVKSHPFSNWAFAGGHLKDFSLTLRRLIDLRDDHLLESAEWIHMLGKGEPDLACLFTVLQRAIRAYVNPDIQISFDHAGHSRLAGLAQVYAGAFFDKHGWSLTDVPLRDASLVGSDEPLHLHLAGTRGRKTNGPPKGRDRVKRRFDGLYSAIAAQLSVGDICIGSSNNLPWDTASWQIAAHHNIEMAVRAYRRAHELFFDDRQINRVPTNARVVAAIIDEVFKSDRPDVLIEECKALLQDVTVNFPRPKSALTAA